MQLQAVAFRVFKKACPWSICKRAAHVTMCSHTCFAGNYFPHLIHSVILWSFFSHATAEQHHNYECGDIDDNNQIHLGIKPNSAMINRKAASNNCSYDSSDCWYEVCHQYQVCHGVVHHSHTHTHSHAHAHGHRSRS